MHCFYGRDITRNVMQQICGHYRKQCNNGMDWNGPPNPPVWIWTSWISQSQLNKIGSQPPCLKKNSIYTYTYRHIWITHQDSSTVSSMDRFTASPLCVLKKRTIKAESFSYTQGSSIKVKIDTTLYHCLKKQYCTKKRKHSCQLHLLRNNLMTKE